MRCSFLVAAVGALQLAACASPGHEAIVRFASFNAAMGLAGSGELSQRLASGDDPALHALARIVQTTRPDVLLLNEFDFSAGDANARWLREHYLAVQHGPAQPIDYPWAYAAPVNTGVASGLDLDGDGATDGPADAWGFGLFPGQYGMLVLSRWPLEAEAVRSFQTFRWHHMPAALEPAWPDGQSFYPPGTWQQLRLSSKSHWDVPIETPAGRVHFLVSHPTPPVFDGEEDRNGRRNHDEIRLWADYVAGAGYIYDDHGQAGGLASGAHFVLAGDLNADPADGDARPGAIGQLLEHFAIDSSCVPTSEGGTEAARRQAGANLAQAGDPAADTADFSDRVTGNLRLDYVLPSRTLRVAGCGVFWPATGHPDHALTEFSDHRLVWVDVVVPSAD